MVQHRFGGEYREYARVIQFFKYLLYVVNFAGWGMGIALFVLGIWFRQEDRFKQVVHATGFEYYYTVTYLFIICGSVVMALGLLGCFGAVQESKGIIIVYCILTFLVFATEIFASIYVFAIGVEGTSLDTFSHDSVWYLMNNYSRDDYLRWVLDMLHQRIECCGVYNFRDWEKISMAVPNSCRDVTTGNQFEWGCQEQLIEYVEGKTAILGSVGFTASFIHLLCLLVSFCLYQAIARDDEGVV